MNNIKDLVQKNMCYVLVDFYVQDQIVVWVSYQSLQMMVVINAEKFNVLVVVG